MTAHRRPTRALALAALVATLLPAAALSQEDGPERRQVAIAAARVDLAAGLLEVHGLDFGEEEAPRVTLGFSDLEVVENDDGYVAALLPEALPPGTYLLIVARGPAVSEYDLFHVHVPAPPSEPAPAVPAPAPDGRGPRGEIGPQGVQGPSGPPGPPGPSGAADLAGRRCPEGSVLDGFGPDGELSCRELTALQPAAPPETLAAPDLAVASIAPAALLASPACGAGDAAWSGRDLPDRPERRLPVLGSYPAASSGTVEGTLSTGDADWLGLQAVETTRRPCLDDRSETPLTARLTLGAAETAVTLCACWSRQPATCDRSANLCVTAPAGAAAVLELPMRMVCGSRDEGVLEAEVFADVESCGGWTLDWQIDG